MNPCPLGPLLGLCAHRAKACLEARLVQYEITPVQAHVLLYLTRSGGEASQSEVTAFLKVKPSTANGVLDRMSEKGLLTRSVSPADARQKRIRLTDQGLEQHARLRQDFDAFEAGLVRDFSPEEQTQLRALLARLLENLETEVPAC